MNVERIKLLKQRLDEFITDGHSLGGAVSGIVKGRKYRFTSGWQDFEKTKKFTSKTIIRQASDTKLMATVAFMKLVENGRITGKENLSDYIPEFANVKVIDVFFPPEPVDGEMKIVGDKGWITVDLELQIGDTIGIQGWLGSDPASVNKQHVIVDIVDGQYIIDVLPDVTVSLPVKVVKLAEGVLSITNGTQYGYYTLVPLDRPVSIWHILTGTIGYLYNILSVGGLVFGYANATNDPVRIAKSFIQGQMIAEKQILMGWPSAGVPYADDNLDQWTRRLTEIPLLFQPGTDWVYGPSINILGDLIEKIDGRSFEQYFKEELTDPLGMEDTGFFIHLDNPRRDEMISRIQPLYLVPAPHVFIPANIVFLPGFDAWFYGAEQPMTLPLAAGGSYSTLADREKFYAMLLNNGRLPDCSYYISPALLSLISETHIRDLVTLPELPPTKEFKWGIGTGIATGSDGIYPFAGQSKRSMYWSGAFGTMSLVDLANESNVQVVNNIVYHLYAPLPAIQDKLVAIHMTALCGVSANDSNAISNPSGTVAMYK